MSLTDLSEKAMVSHHAYQEGFSAYWDGILYEQNPYLADTVDHQRWADGWTTSEGNDYEDF